MAADPRDHGPEHGTHCVGIIAADQTNHLGGQGVADRVRILLVRYAPAGDERNTDCRPPTCKRPAPPLPCMAILLVR